MTLNEFISVLRSHHLRPFGRGRKYRSQCPAHGSKGGTLGIYDDKGKVGVHCFAGCPSDAVLAALGLTWKDLTENRTFMPRSEYKAMKQREREAERKSRDIRIGEWCIRLAQRGYTLAEHKRDAMLVVACQVVLEAHPESERWLRILRVHQEKIEAAMYCKRQGISLKGRNA